MNFIVHPPRLITRFYHNLTWKINEHSSAVYLTFDDGPTPETTPYLLATLQEYNAKATFFCVGDNVRKYPYLFKQIQESGHQVGNHTFNHLNGVKTNSETYLQNIKLAQELIPSKLFRPPYGRLTFSQRKNLSKEYQIIMWDILTRDYDQRVTKEQCLNYVQQYARAGSIIVFHDNIKAMDNLKYALPRTLEYLQSKKFQFLPIP